MGRGVRGEEGEGQPVLRVGHRACEEAQTRARARTPPLDPRGVPALLRGARPSELEARAAVPPVPGAPQDFPPHLPLLQRHDLRPAEGEGGPVHAALRVRDDLLCLRFRVPGRLLGVAEHRRHPQLEHHLRGLRVHHDLHVRHDRRRPRHLRPPAGGGEAGAAVRDARLLPRRAHVCLPHRQRDDVPVERRARRLLRPQVRLLGDLRAPNPRGVPSHHHAPLRDEGLRRRGQRRLQGLHAHPLPLRDADDPRLGAREDVADHPRQLQVRGDLPVPLREQERHRRAARGQPGHRRRAAQVPQGHLRHSDVPPALPADLGPADARLLERLQHGRRAREQDRGLHRVRQQHEALQAGAVQDGPRGQRRL